MVARPDPDLVVATQPTATEVIGVIAMSAVLTAGDQPCEAPSPTASQDDAISAQGTATVPSGALFVRREPSRATPVM